MKKTNQQPRLRIPVSLFILLFVRPPEALAHLVTTGMGPVYDGIGHLLLTPEDLIPVAAIAVLAGLRGRPNSRLALFLLPISWLLGGSAGLCIGCGAAALLPALSIIVLGALIAADLHLHLKFFVSLVIAVGLIHGFLSGCALKGGAGAYGLFGILAVVFISTAFISAFIVSLKPTWARIAVRVSGSWMAAVGMLMIGWYVKGLS